MKFKGGRLFILMSFCVCLFLVALGNIAFSATVRIEGGGIDGTYSLQCLSIDNNGNINLTVVSGTSTGTESGTTTASDSGTSTGTESGTTTASDSGTSTGTESGTTTVDLRSAIQLIPFKTKGNTIYPNQTHNYYFRADKDYKGVVIMIDGQWSLEKIALMASKEKFPTWSTYNNLKNSGRYSCRDYASCDTWYVGFGTPALKLSIENSVIKKGDIIYITVFGVGSSAKPYQIYISPY